MWRHPTQTLLAVATLLCSLVNLSSAQAQRFLVIKEPCFIPFSFNGEVFEDCMSFSGMEWCPGADGEFGVCESTTGPSPPGENATEETPLAITESSTVGQDTTVPTVTKDATVPTVAGDMSAATSCCDLVAATGFRSELPIIVLDSRGAEVPDEPKIDGIMCTCGSPAGDIAEPMGIEIRGSTSARDFSKKSFALEIRDENGDDKDINLLGLTAESDWVLYGPEMDRTMGMKNYLTMSLFRDTGRYASGVVYCEVFLIEDGGRLDIDHYNGLYILMEKVKRHDDRVSVNKHKEEDLSGGYIFKYDNDNFDPGDRIFTSDFSQLKFVLTYPKKDNAEDHHLGWIGGYVSNFEEALSTGTRANWEPFIDELSFVDIFIITELTKNPDGYRGSFYFHKDVGAPLTAGPPWDYNEAYGTCCGYPIEGFLEDGKSDGLSGGSAISPEGWRFNICIEPERCQVDPLDGVSRWFQMLMADSGFRNRVSSRWGQLRSSTWSSTRVNALFIGASSKIQSAVVRNHNRWSDVHKGSSAADYIETWTNEVNSVKTWLDARLKWMDRSLGQISRKNAGG